MARDVSPGRTNQTERGPEGGAADATAVKRGVGDGRAPAAQTGGEDAAPGEGEQRPEVVFAVPRARGRRARRRPRRAATRRVAADRSLIRWPSGSDGASAPCWSAAPV